MTTRLKSNVLMARDEVVAPPMPLACDDHSFELPAGVYVAMASMFAGFVAVLNFAFHDHMGVSFAVIFAFLAAFFLIPMLFARAKAEASRTRALGWCEFQNRGIATATGRASASAATILVLLLPFLILCFGIAVAAIAALA